MTSKEKKESVILGVVLLAMFVIIYVNFLKPKSAPPVLEGTSAMPAVGGAPTAAGMPGAATMPGATAAPAAGGGAFLPNGTKLDLQFLNDPRFMILIPPSYPTVTSSEVGKDNPFGQ